ncbi:DUF6907 domain-containing protein [Streptomyces gossypiisoli]|uniref:DUF6907 domain-containing protein n=1 Tax=Streptomyces gossypiisoli TaxID=2748864 RepID=UPI0015DA1F27|nr:hypothetical protein [Streptomyces gossypiisoli]
MQKSAISQHVAGTLPSIPQQPTADGQSIARPGERMVPALIGWPGRQTTALIACPEWCEIDHVDNWAHALEDVDHYGEDDGWSTDSVLQPGDVVIELYTRVHSDPTASSAAMREAHVIVGDRSGSGDCYLTPEMAERAADEMIAFAADIRNKARAARRANALAGRSRRRVQQVELRKLSGEAV